MLDGKLIVALTKLNNIVKVLKWLKLKLKNKKSYIERLKNKNKKKNKKEMT